MESQVNHKTQPFWVKGVRLVNSCHTLTGFARGALCSATMATLKLDAVYKTKSSFGLPGLRFWFLANVGSRNPFITTWYMWWLVWTWKKLRKRLQDMPSVKKSKIWKNLFRAKNCLKTILEFLLFFVSNYAKILNQNCWVLWFTWDSVCTSFQKSVLREKLHIVDIPRTTCLPRLVNVVCEGPLMKKVSWTDEFSLFNSRIKDLWCSIYHWWRPKTRSLHFTMGWKLIFFLTFPACF